MQKNFVRQNDYAIVRFYWCSLVRQTAAFLQLKADLTKKLLQILVYRCIIMHTIKRQSRFVCVKCGVNGELSF